MLRVLPGTAARSYALLQFFDRGFDADSFGSKSVRAPRVAMVDALVATEDWLEIRKPSYDRSAIRALRRRLEQELWS